MKMMIKPASADARYQYIDTAFGRLKLLIVSPKQLKEKTTGVLWMHGGGYATGMAEMVYSSRAIDLVTQGGAVVIAPSYKLSVLHPYPTALIQCHDALIWVREHAEELGIRDDQIMVGGESAGGGLCVALCMYALDNKSVNIAFQMPLYPMLDCQDTDSSRDNHEKVWNTRRNHQAWKLYLRDLDESLPVPEYASPARRSDYAGLPPCYTFVGDIEPFHDETLNYIASLQKAGVEAQCDVYEGWYHGYDMVNDKDPLAVRAAEDFIARFKEARERHFAAQTND